MRQFILIAAAMALVLSAALLAVAPVHAQSTAGSCRGLSGGVYHWAVADAAQTNPGIARGAFDPQNPTNCSFPGTAH
jgi:hypothetical protein